MAKGQKKQKQTPEVIAKLESVFAIDGTIREACFYANIGESTYYEWVKNDKELLERFERLREKPVLKARREVIKGLDGNPEFSLKYLERKRKNEFSLRTEHKVENERNDEFLDELKKINDSLTSNKTSNSSKNS